jgi:beta-lactam-binding protein with PASTA domain
MSLHGFVLRLAVVAIACAVVTGAAMTYAAQRFASPNAKATGTPKQQTLVVPDVEGQVYVFAKGILEEGGFGWVVNGAVRGYAVDVVAKQFPAPGTTVVNSGAPMITLTLARNPKFKEQGQPEDQSPYPPTVLLLAKQQTPSG